MSEQMSSFISSKQLSLEQLHRIFSRAKWFKSEFGRSGRIHQLVDSEEARKKILSLVFLEPSTRTRTSFQVAALRLGLRVVLLDNPLVTSTQKGESLADTLRNVAAMLPDAMIVRYGVDRECDELLQTFGCPVINAGIGTMEHPTQALLDAFTILENRGGFRDERILIVGDVLHSRVANSDLVLLQMLGAEVAYCAPAEFIPKEEAWKSVKSFSDIDEGMEWASVVICLRIQKERHSTQSVGLTIAEYREKYRVGGDQLKRLRPDGILLHPGPVNRGVELSNFAFADPRCKVLEQVTNGVFVRSSLLSYVLGLEVIDG